MEFMENKTRDIDFYRKNADEDFATTPISVLRYISELEAQLKEYEDYKKAKFDYRQRKRQENKGLYSAVEKVVKDERFSITVDELKERRKALESSPIEQPEAQLNSNYPKIPDSSKEAHKQLIDWMYKSGILDPAEYPEARLILDDFLEAQKSKPEAPQQESQARLWMDVCVESNAIEEIGVSKVIQKLMQYFTITRKPL